MKTLAWATLMVAISSSVTNASSFTQLNVKKLTNDKCDSSQAILILEFAFEGDCSAQDGHCTQAVSLDLAPVSSICGYGSPLPNYDSAAVKAYFVGWAVKGVNWVSDPDRWSQQVSTLVFGLNNQSVSGSKLNLDFEAWASAAHPGDGFSPENRAISARVEVVAVNPNYAEYVKIDLDTTESQRATGTLAGASTSHQSTSSFPFAFAGLSRFVLHAEDGQVVPGYPFSSYYQGVNLNVLDFSVSAFSSAAGTVNLIMDCQVEGSPRAGSTQETYCSADHVIVFAEPTFMYRPANQPEENYSEIVGNSEVRSVSEPGIPGHGGRTPCPLTRFRFEVEPWFKYNELIAEGTDCDRVFGGTALYEMKVQGDSFKDTGSGGPDQSPVAFCPEPSGASYVCLQKPAWSGLIWLDTAILE